MPRAGSASGREAHVWRPLGVEFGAVTALRNEDKMINVEFTDTSAGRWGFNTTVRFTLAPNKANPGGNLILRVRVKCEILNCDDTLKRAGPDKLNYTVLENFGPFSPTKTEICDFHQFYGAALIDAAYNANEKIKITITGEVFLQDTKDSTPGAEKDAYKLTTPSANTGVRESQKQATGRKWTTPGILEGPGAQGMLVGERKSPITTYTLVYIYSKCGEEKTWSGSITSTIATPIAMLILRPRDEFFASYSPAEEAEFGKLTAALQQGDLAFLSIASAPSYDALLSLPNAGAKIAARLRKAKPIETLVLASLARELGDPKLVAPLRKAAAKKDVVLRTRGVGAESFRVSEIVGEAIDTLRPKGRKS